MAAKKKYKKDKILRSKRYMSDYDIVNTLLEADKEYTLEEVNKKIEAYKKGAVS